MMANEKPMQLSRVDWQSNFITAKANSLTRHTLEEYDKRIRPEEYDRRIRPDKDRDGYIIPPPEPTDEQVLELANDTIRSAEELLKETEFIL